jgi:hypothetical protein
MKLFSLNYLKGGIKSRIFYFYENWVIPPQRESLLELKKKEFREKTKYLKPEVFYGLTVDEKNGKYLII